MADGGNIQFYLFGAALRFGLLHSGLFGLSERPELGYRIFYLNNFNINIH